MAVLSQGLRVQLLASVSSVVLMSAAQAADLGYPTKAAPAYVAPPMWTGFYAGLNAGAAWHKWSDDINELNSTSRNNVEVWSGNKAAFTFGGQLGYNWQYGNFVYGAEADLNWVGSKNDASFLNPEFSRLFTTSTKLDWLATFRGRLGVTVTPATLLYATGGLALAGVRDTIIQASVSSSPVTNDKTLAGYAVGAGFEYMFMQDWTAKLEGLYIGLPNSTTTISGSDTYQTEFKHSAALVRLGINRKF